MIKYNLDRTHFQKLTVQEADAAFNDHSDMDWKERLKLAMYLNSIAYQYVGLELPVMDKTVFETRMLKDG